MIGRQIVNRSQNQSNLNRRAVSPANDSCGNGLAFTGKLWSYWRNPGVSINQITKLCRVQSLRDAGAPAGSPQTNCLRLTATLLSWQIHSISTYTSSQITYSNRLTIWCIVWETVKINFLFNREKLFVKRARCRYDQIAVWCVFVRVVGRSLDSNLRRQKRRFRGWLPRMDSNHE
jgi:hypothetical protein